MKSILSVALTILFCASLNFLSYSYVLVKESAPRILPKIAFFSIYMNQIKYSHMPLLLASMKHNPRVQFILIHVVSNTSDTFVHRLPDLIHEMRVSNFDVHIISFDELSNRIQEKLNISVNITNEWYYKLCDYKPTLAFLFEELVKEDQYKFWGVGDMDLVRYALYSNMLL